MKYILLTILAAFTMTSVLPTTVEAASAKKSVEGATAKGAKKKKGKKGKKGEKGSKKGKKAAAAKK